MNYKALFKSIGMVLALMFLACLYTLALETNAFLTLKIVFTAVGVLFIVGMIKFFYFIFKTEMEDEDKKGEK